MKKWEYQHVHLGSSGGRWYVSYDVLETLGELEWELVAVYDKVAYFKRSLEEINGEEKSMHDALQEIGACLREHGVDLNTLEKEVLRFRKGDNGEEEKAALKEEENKEDEGESKGAAWHPFRTAQCRCYCCYRCLS